MMMLENASVRFDQRTFPMNDGFTDMHISILQNESFIIEILNEEKHLN